MVFVKRRLAPAALLLLTAFVLAGLQLASDSFAAEGPAHSDTFEASSAQLSIGHAYEAAGRFADAEGAYRKGLEIGDSRTRADALAALEKVVRLRADDLSLAKALEARGRSSDAEAAYLTVLKAGDPRSRSAALDGLARLSASKDTGGAAAMLDVARALEEAGRWEDSEAIYRQVLQSGSPTQRQVALARVKYVAKIRDSFWEKQVTPLGEAFLKVLVPAVLLLLLMIPVNRILKWFFSQRHRGLLSVGDFGHTDGAGAPGDTFGGTLKLMHERMSTHFRERTIVGGAGGMPVLLGSSSSDVLDLIAETNESLVPFQKWFSKVTRQPGYQIDGWTEATWRNIKVCATLEHSGKTISQWSRSYLLRDWFECEQDLAYEILIRLKEYTNDHAA